MLSEVAIQVQKYAIHFLTWYFGRIEFDAVWNLKLFSPTSRVFFLATCWCFSGLCSSRHTCWVDEATKSNTVSTECLVEFFFCSVGCVCSSSKNSHPVWWTMHSPANQAIRRQNDLRIVSLVLLHASTEDLLHIRRRLGRWPISLDDYMLDWYSRMLQVFQFTMADSAQSS